LDNLLWYHCTKCGQKLLKYSDAAKSEGVYIKCKRCKQEVEVKLNIKKGA